MSARDHKGLALTEPMLVPSQASDRVLATMAEVLTRKVDALISKAKPAITGLGRTEYQRGGIGFNA